MLKQFYFRIFSLFILLLCTVSCLQSYKPFLHQSQEDQVVDVSDITSLRCRLTTGEAKENKAHLTDARKFVLEKKISDGKYKLIKNDTVVYESVSPKTNKKTTGYINNFPYVQVKSIEEGRVTTEKSSSNDSFNLIKKGQLSCHNLITADQVTLLRAKPHQTYDLRFQIIGQNIRAVLVAPAELLPYQSLAYSLKLDSSSKTSIYAMPIGGYSVSLGYLEQQINSNREATNVLSFRSVPIAKHQGYVKKNQEGLESSLPQFTDESEQVSTVSHVQIPRNFQNFTALSETGAKKDVYPKSLFLGDWYYSRTSVKQQLNSRLTLLGIQSSYDSDFKSGHGFKIRVELEKNHLIGYSLDRESNEEDTVHGEKRWVFKIPVSHLEYWASASGKDLNAGLSEVANTTLDYDKKTWIQLQFDGIKHPSNPYQKSPSSQQLEELVFSDDFLSFVLKSEATDDKFKYSLVRVKSKEETDYTPFHLRSELLKRFGVFRTSKRFPVLDRLIQTEEYQESFLSNRFDINKPIVYRFSSISSKNKLVRNLGREAINIWQQVFDKAGVSCPDGKCITLDESKDVELGDTRYNVLNIVWTKNTPTHGRLAGYGPSIADFETGEIISATANSYLDVYYLNTMRSIYNYLQAKTGLISSFVTRLETSQPNQTSLSASLFDLNLFQKTNLFLDTLDVTSKTIKRIPFYGASWLPNSKELQIKSDFGDLITSKEEEDEINIRYFLATKGQGLSHASWDEKYKKVIEHNKDHLSSSSYSDHSCEMQKAAGFLPQGDKIYKLIDKLCSDELSFISDMKGAQGITQASPHEKSIFLKEASRKSGFEEEMRECAVKLLPVVALNTLVHEIGHNLGMAHNFAASADAENFASNQDFNHDYIFDNISEDKKKTILEDVATPGSSSVMDYLGSNALSLIPGNYDVGYVRLFYGEQIETTDGSFVDVDHSVAWKTRDGEDIESLKIKPYYYCSDWDVYISSDIYCARFDVGSSAYSIVKNYYNLYIKDYLSLYTSDIKEVRNIHGRLMLAFIQATSSIYQKWRLELSKVLDSSDPKYLTEEVSAEGYLKKLFALGLIKVEGSKKPDGKLYDLFLARNLISATLQNIFFSLNDKYCVVEDTYRKVKQVVALQSLKKELRDNPIKGLKNVSSCKDLTQIFQRSGQHLVSEFGMPLYPGRFAMNKYPLAGRIEYLFDYSGSVLMRVFSAIGLAISHHSYVLGSEFDQPISLMDEPDISEKVLDRFIDRISNGVGYNLSTAEKQQNYQGLVFSNEEKIYSALSRFFFLKSRHATNVQKFYQNILQAIARILPVRVRGDGIGVDRLLLYLEARSEGGYLLDESKELNKRGSSMLYLGTPGQSSLIGKLSKVIRSNELRRSMHNLSSAYIKHHPELREKPFAESRHVFYKFLEEVGLAVVNLFSQKALEVGAMTTALLYDTLEAAEQEEGPSPLRYRDHLAPMLQASYIKYFRIVQAFAELCQKTNNTQNCPTPYMIGHLHQSDRDGLNETGRTLFDEAVNKIAEREFDLKDHVEIIRVFIQGKSLKLPYINEAKPWIDEIMQELKTNPESIKKYADLIDSLYRIELFRSDAFTGSSVQSSLNQAFSLAKQYFATRKHGKLDSETQTKLEKEIKLIKESISSIQSLVRFPNSKFLQELLFRNIIQQAPALMEFVKNLDLSNSVYNLITTINSASGDSEKISRLVLKQLFSKKINEEIQENTPSSVILTNLLKEKFRSQYAQLNTNIKHLMNASIEDVKSKVQDNEPHLYVNMNVSKEPLGPLGNFFRRQTQVELNSQYNLVLNSVIPFFDIYEGSSSGFHGTVSSGQLSGDGVFEENKKILEAISSSF